VATRLPTAARNAAANAVCDLIDADAGAGTCKVYTGTQPASANDAPSGTLLLTFTLSDPAFGSPTLGVKTLAGVPLSTTGLAAGTAGWCRLADQSGDTVLDGSAGATSSGAQFELSTTTVSIGLTVDLTAGTITMPAA